MLCFRKFVKRNSCIESRCTRQTLVHLSWRLHFFKCCGDHAQIIKATRGAHTIPCYLIMLTRLCHNSATNSISVKRILHTSSALLSALFSSFAIPFNCFVPFMCINCSPKNHFFFFCFCLRSVSSACASTNAKCRLLRVGQFVSPSFTLHLFFFVSFFLR